MLKVACQNNQQLTDLGVLRLSEKETSDDIRTTDDIRSSQVRFLPHSLLLLESQSGELLASSAPDQTNCVVYQRLMENADYCDAWL